MNPVGYLETGVIWCEDNLDQLTEFPAECVDLVYLDPPFFSNRFYEVIWGDEAEIRSFEDRWDRGIEHYVEWMEYRLVELHRVLKPTGSLYLHCDPSASHYLKVKLDAIFGRNRFLSEVAWKRTTAHSSARRYGPVHDTLLVYTRGDAYVWNPIYTPYDQGYVELKYRFIEPETGRRYRKSDLTGAGTRQGATGLPWRGIDVTSRGRHWMVPPDQLEELDAQGRILWPKKAGGVPEYKR